ncbi:MAG: hypothetical protein LBG47_02550 [Prevotellaceae bacterium]|jgi:hypothetical protein|nr:hypothetical protein [Prevotellaceae bacterium]
MASPDTDVTTKAGRRPLSAPEAASEAETVGKHEIPCDENGNPIGYTVDEVFDKIDLHLSEVYGVDFAKLSRLVKLGELSMDDVTDDMLLSPELKYEPYPGFKPKPLPAGFTPDANMRVAL